MSKSGTGYLVYDIFQSPEETDWMEVTSKMNRHSLISDNTKIRTTTVKAASLVMVIVYGVLTFLGRGSLGLIQGVFGLLFGIQGYYGILEYNKKDIRNLIVWLLISSGGCVAIGLLSFQKEDSYCRGLSEKEENDCRVQVQWWVFTYLILGTIINIGLLFVFCRFYWRMVQSSTIGNVSKNAAKLLH